jgi:WD40 repeat protein
LITINEFNLRATIWNLTDKSSVFISDPKHSEKGLAFSNDGRFMALCVRRDCVDHIDVFNVVDWRLLSTFPTGLDDLEGLQWMKDDTAIVCWDNASASYRVAVYTPEGRELAVSREYENALGVKNVTLSGNGNFIAVGAFDKTVRIINHITWRTLQTLEHKPEITGRDVHVYYEEEYAENHFVTS